MARGGWASPASFARNRDSFFNSAPWECLVAGGVGDGDGSASDEEFLLMTDAEKEAFAAMQSRLEEQFLSQFHRRPRHHDGRLSIDGATGVDTMGEGYLECADGGGKHLRGKSLDSRPESRGVPSRGRRSRSDVSAARGHRCGSTTGDEWTFHPLTNRTNVASRYLTEATRREGRTTAECGTEEALSFTPVVNRLPISSLSDRLGRYLHTPVYKRLGQTTPAHASGRVERCQRPREVQRCEKGPRGNVGENRLSEAFLRRLEETNRRREGNLQRIAQTRECELTFRPKLAPGTRQRRVSSVVAAHIQGQPMAQSISSRVGSEELGEAAAAKRRDATPHINARSRVMRRSTDDLCLFEQRRQQRLRQLKAEQEAAERAKLSGTPAVSAGSLRLARTLFGKGVTHEAIQQYLQQQADLRAATLRAECEAKQRDEKKQFTFCPEVHPVPPYLHDIAQELAANKTFAVKPLNPKPTFRF